MKEVAACSSGLSAPTSAASSFTSASRTARTAAGRPPVAGSPASGLCLVGGVSPQCGAPPESAQDTCLVPAALRARHLPGPPSAAPSGPSARPRAHPSALLLPSHPCCTLGVSGELCGQIRKSPPSSTGRYPGWRTQLGGRVVREDRGEGGARARRRPSPVGGQAQGAPGGGHITGPAQAGKGYGVGAGWQVTRQGPRVRSEGPPVVLPERIGPGWEPGGGPGLSKASGSSGAPL